MNKQAFDLTQQAETARRIAACVNAFEGISTDRIEGKNLGEILAGEVRLNGAGPRADGGFGFEFSGGVCQLMAEAYAEQFRQSGAINYLELLFNHSDIGPLTITMQRVEGLTPAQKLAQAEAECANLRQAIDDVLAQRDALAAENAALKSNLMFWDAEDPESPYDSPEDIANNCGMVFNTEFEVQVAAKMPNRTYRVSEVGQYDCKIELVSGAIPETPATDAYLNSVRADVIRQVSNEAQGYEEQFKRPLTSEEWSTLIGNYWASFDGLSQSSAGKGGE